MKRKNTNRYRPHPELPGVSVLTITRAKCPPGGDERGPREIEFLLDTSDVAFASRHTWHAHWYRCMRSFYAMTDLRTATWRTSVQLHRMLLAPDDSSIEVDHRNGITTDNRRENLRLATHADNMRNRRVQRNNTSGHCGVCWDKQQQCWRVQIGVNGKQTYLGLYDSFAEAIAARLAAEAKHFGEFAYSARPAAPMEAGNAP
jgi:hypothetical protein